MWRANCIHLSTPFYIGDFGTHKGPGINPPHVPRDNLSFGESSYTWIFDCVGGLAPLTPASFKGQQYLTLHWYWCPQYQGLFNSCRRCLFLQVIHLFNCWSYTSFELYSFHYGQCILFFFSAIDSLFTKLNCQDSLTFYIFLK